MVYMHRIELADAISSSEYCIRQIGQSEELAWGKTKPMPCMSSCTRHAQNFDFQWNREGGRTAGID